MLRGLYTAGTGMLVNRTRMDVITNNIVNVDTTGYKKDTMLSRSFADMLLNRLDDPNVINQRAVSVGDHNTGTHVDEMVTTFAQGTPEMTELRTDLCMEGPGFFVLQTSDGERYTRTGNFTLDNEGYLLNSDGYYVLNTENAPIQLPHDRFKVDVNGQITNLDDLTEIAQLRVVEFDDVTQLRKEGNNLYFDYGEAGPKEAENTRVLQGYIETSNVNIAAEMVDMIITNRAYEANQRMVRMIDETLQRTVNDIARF